MLVFLPQILLLFLFIGVLEDSGYLARAALIADRVMRTIGLNGKAFIPLLSAYACAVPAIMATRTIENKRDRLATILVTPFMTCSARLPVYLLLIAAFIPNIYFLHGVLGLRTLVMLGLYVAGFVAAFTTARLLKSSILKSSDTPFILELPQYRMPTLYSLGAAPDGSRAHLPEECRHHHRRRHAGAVGAGASAGHSHRQRRAHALRNWPTASSAGWATSSSRPSRRSASTGRSASACSRSVLAREVMVSTMGTLYGADPSTQALSLQTALHHDMTLGGALALMIFFAFAMQCTSTIAVVKRETNSWKWPAVQFLYMLVLAYGAAFAVNHITMMFIH